MLWGLFNDIWFSVALTSVMGFGFADFLQEEIDTAECERHCLPQSLN